MDFWNGLEPKEIEALAQVIRPNTEKKEYKDLENPERLATDLFFSFFHSQGDSWLQFLLLKWLKLNNPDLKFSETEIEKVSKLFEKKREKFYEKYGSNRPNEFGDLPAHSPEGKYSPESSHVKDLQLILSEGDLADKAASLSEEFKKAYYEYESLINLTDISNKILIAMISLEKGYLSRLQGRTRPEREYSKGDILADKFFSQFCEFVVLDNLKTSPDFKILFADLKQIFRKGYKAEPVRYQEVVDKYLSTHPDKSLQIEQALR